MEYRLQNFTQTEVGTTVFFLSSLSKGTSALDRSTCWRSTPQQSIAAKNDASALVAHPIAQPPPLAISLCHARLFKRWLATSVEEGGAGGLDWAKTNLQGHTVCHKAALKGHRGLIEWLNRKTEESVVPECAWGRDEGGYTPKDVARLAGHVDLAELLGEGEKGASQS